jgi:hypothetical protein
MSTANRADAVQEFREEVFRECLYSQLMEGGPEECCPSHAIRVSDAELDAAIAETTMSREDYLECERIANEEADLVSARELQELQRLEPRPPRS